MDEIPARLAGEAGKAGFNRIKFMSEIEKTKKNMFLCRCKFCPTYSLGCLVKATPQIVKAFLEPRGSEKEKKVENMFCVYGSSRCIKEKKGCKCPKCPVFKKYQLDKTYYCLGGIYFDATTK